MLRALLVERFGLKFHRQEKEFSIYELTVARGGSKLKLAANPDDPPEIVGVVYPGKIEVPAKSVTMDDFVAMLQRATLDRPIVRRGAWDAALSTGALRLINYDVVAALSDDEDMLALIGASPPSWTAFYPAKARTLARTAPRGVAFRRIAAPPITITTSLVIRDDSPEARAFLQAFRTCAH